MQDVEEPPFNNNKLRRWVVGAQDGMGVNVLAQSIIGQTAFFFFFLPASSGSVWFPAAAPVLTLALAMSPWQPAGTGSHLRG